MGDFLIGYPSTKGDTSAIWHHFCLLKARGDGGRTTSQGFVEILCFQHFARHTVFEQIGEKEKNKLIKSWVPVSVVVELGYGNTSL